MTEKLPDAPYEIGSDVALSLKIEQYQDAKRREASAKTEAEELRSEILESVWIEGSGTGLTEAGFGGLALTSQGFPLIRVSERRPNRLDTAGLKRAHPDLVADFTHPAAKAEVRLEILG